MIRAYILLILAMSGTKTIFEQIKNLPHIESISVVTGIYDVIIKVQVDNLEQLYDLTYNQFCEVEGIKEMTTFIIEKEIIPAED